MIRSSAELLRLPPADVERRIAGAKRRWEWWRDDMAILLTTISAPHVKRPIRAEDLTGGRRIGTSQVPGYREEDAGG